jgi:hypothetical protein
MSNLHCELTAAMLNTARAVIALRPINKRDSFFLENAPGNQRDQVVSLFAGCKFNQEKIRQ